MRFSLFIGLAGAGLASAQYRYADNQQPLEKDPPQVAANFPDVDVELLSPAFLDTESVPEAFANGTAGPTSQRTLGESVERLPDALIPIVLC